MPYLFKFDYCDGENSEFHGNFKLIVNADSSLNAKENATRLILEATKNDDEFFESGSKIWLKELLFIEEGPFKGGVIYDFTESSNPELRQSYPRAALVTEYLEGEKGYELTDAQPFYVIP